MILSVGKNKTCFENLYAFRTVEERLEQVEVPVVYIPPEKGGGEVGYGRC